MDSVESHRQLKLEVETKLSSVNNILQLRIYTLNNELCVKETFHSNQLNALKKMKTDCFDDATAGPYISRCTVRILDTVRCDWALLPIMMEVNNHALIFDSNIMAAMSWKIEFFDVVDEVIATEISEVPFAEEYIACAMATCNAVYCTICVLTTGAPEGRQFYRLYKVILNPIHNLTVIGPDGNLLKPYVAFDYEDAVKVCAKAFERDMKETERILAHRKDKQNG